MANLRELVSFMDEALRTAEVKDYTGAMNGLQLENSGEVRKVFAAVDASLAVVEEAAKEQGSLLIVHHGMFWPGVQPITGAYYKKLKVAMAGDLAIYSSHLPLDVHPVFGNNILLSRTIGLKEFRPVFEKDGFPMGVCGQWGKTFSEFEVAVSRAVRRGVVSNASGPVVVGEVVVMTGGAGSMIREVAEAGFDTFLTGEGPHWSYVEAEERRVNVVYAGHYATETFGVKELARVIGEKFCFDSKFIERDGVL